MSSHTIPPPQSIEPLDSAISGAPLPFSGPMPTSRFAKQEAHERSLKALLNAQQEREYHLMEKARIMTELADQLRNSQDEERAHAQQEIQLLREAAARTGHQIRETAARTDQQIRETAAKTGQQIRELEQTIAKISEDHITLRSAARRKLDTFSKREERFKAAIIGYRDRQKKLEAEIGFLNESLGRAHSQLSVLRFASAQAEAFEAEVKTLKQQLDAVRSSLTATRQRAEFAENTGKERELALHGLQRRVQELELSTRELENNLHQARREAESNATTLGETTGLLKGSQASREQAELQAKKLGEENISLRNSLEANRRETESLRTAHQSAIEAMSQKLQEAQANAQGYESRVEEMSKQLGLLRDASQELRAQVEEAHNHSEEEPRPVPVPPPFRPERKFSDEPTISTESLEPAAQKNAPSQLHPLQRLLALKEKELQRAGHELNRLPLKHPARKQAEEIFEALTDQRDRVRQVLNEYVSPGQ